MLDRSECQKPSMGAQNNSLIGHHPLNQNTSSKSINFRLGIRSSKYKHVYGSPAKKQKCYENVKISRNAHDGSFCAVNPKFLAVVVEVGGGGSFVVVPLDKVGRLEHNVPKVSGHSRPVLDIKWNPFNDNIIASGSEDCTVKLWYIPDQGLTSDLNDHILDLQGHRRRVMYLEWHPTAENILLSAGYDHRILVWNIARGQAVNCIECHPDTIYSMSFNRSGSLLATTCKDKKLRIIDPRAAEVLREGQCHQGTKASKVVYLGDTGRLFTTGFSRFSDRQYAIWSQNDLSRPMSMEIIDSSSGILYPYYDHDTGMVYVAGKGDGNVRYYEVSKEGEAEGAYYLAQFISGHPQRGLGVLPKRGCDTSKCEVFRFYKLHATRECVEPISMIVPRKSDVFQDDIYPETAAPTPSLTAEEWLSGQNALPLLMSLKSGTRIRTFKPVVYKPGDSSNSGGSNSAKFNFLSEEARGPDYRPIDVIRRSDPYRQSPKIDHRPLGAESYGRASASNSDRDTPTLMTSSKHRKQDLESSKFQDVHRKWQTGGISKSPEPPTASAGSEELDQLLSSSVPLPSGSTPVKSLTGRFNGTNGNHHGNNSKNGTEMSEEVLKVVVSDQKRQIDMLKLEVAAKDRRIAALEERVKKLSSN